jgi:hypothetical protein
MAADAFTCTSVSLWWANCESMYTCMYVCVCILLHARLCRFHGRSMRPCMCECVCVSV